MLGRYRRGRSAVELEECEAVVLATDLAAAGYLRLDVRVRRIRHCRAQRP